MDGPQEDVAPGIRVCYASLVSEPGSADGALKRCTRCKTALYATRELQREHWSIHKRVCRVPNRGVASGLSFREVYRRVVVSLKAGGDADLAVLLARLVHLWEHQEDDDGMEEAEMKLHTIGRGYIFAQLDGLSKRLWACPGMPEFLLAGEDLLSPIERRKAEFFPLGMPSYEAAELLLQGEQQSR